MKSKLKLNLQFHAVKSLDAIKLEKAEIMNKINKAITEGNEEDFAQAFTDFTDHIQQAVMDEANGLVQNNDTTILLGRGARQLTSLENKFYQKTMEAMKSSNPKQALAELDVVMPVTIIDAVFEDLRGNHPLLDVINFQNTSGMVEFLVNTHSTQLATWKPLCAEIVKELTSGFKKVNLTLNKLSAFLPVCKAMLDLGPIWLDRYARAILAEATLFGLEEGIINGNGVDMPVGMNRDITKPKDPTTGIPEKATVPVTSLDPVTYGQLISGMAVTPNGNTRVVKQVIMVVNPVDYLQKIMPATTIRGADGQYVNNVFPFPTVLIESTQIPVGKAIIGLANRYFMGVGTEKSGKIEYSDEYRFLEDERIYLVKLYGHGEPLDNSAFIYADISGLKPAIQKVTVEGTVATKEVV